MKNQKHKEFIDRCTEYTRQKTQEILSDYDLNSYEDYHFDTTRGELLFSIDGEIEVTAMVDLIGTYFKEASTWTWAWDNTLFTPYSYLNDMHRVHSALKDRGLEQHTASDRVVSPLDCQHMSAIAAYTLRARGAISLRVRELEIDHYLIVRDIGWMDDIEKQTEEAMNHMLRLLKAG